MGSRVWAFSALAAVGTFVLPSIASADSGPQPHTIAVTATGTVEYQPDIATLDFGVRANSTAPDVAAVTVANAAQTVLKAIRDLGIDDRDIKTTGYQIEYQPANQYGNQSPASYVATENIQIAQVPIGSVGSVIAAAVQAGAGEVAGPYYESSRRADLQNQAMVRALDAAKSEGGKIASRSGVRLIGLYSLTVVNPWTAADYSPPEPGTRVLGRVTTHATPPINGGMSTLAMVVEAVYEIK